MQRKVFKEYLLYKLNAGSLPAFIISPPGYNEIYRQYQWIIIPTFLMSLSVLKFIYPI
jgi:hypothetical protein